MLFLKVEVLLMCIMEETMDDSVYTIRTGNRGSIYIEFPGRDLAGQSLKWTSSNAEVLTFEKGQDCK